MKCTSVNTLGLMWKEEGTFNDARNEQGTTTSESTGGSFRDVEEQRTCDDRDEDGCPIPGGQTEGILASVFAAPRQP